MPRTETLPTLELSGHYTSRLMNLHETHPPSMELAPSLQAAEGARRHPKWRASWRLSRLLGLLVLVAWLAGGSALNAEEVLIRHIRWAVSGHEFDLLHWEASALSAKGRAAIFQPAQQVAPAAQATFVVEHIARAQHIRQLETEISRLVSPATAEPASEITSLQAEVTTLRHQQLAERAAVEQIIERQVATILAEAGLAWGDIVLPPVKFAFVEPPKKLVVSPRSRIETSYSQMLSATIDPQAIRQAEARMHEQPGISAYITNIGGLGAYPSMVVDDASLAWILSTVAHEWVHNYLTFFPLGFTYGSSSENIIINETIAEIVGNEIGDQVLRRFYPSEVPPPVEPMANEETASAPPRFDYRKEMRLTRIGVDQFLAQGKVTEAERYMALRQERFRANGYALRVLNQAFFAFHGSYGTGPASSSPLGPKLERLRALIPTLADYLRVVRTLTTPTAVDQALADWEARAENASPGSSQFREEP